MMTLLKTKRTSDFSRRDRKIRNKRFLRKVNPSMITMKSSRKYSKTSPIKKESPPPI